MNLSENLHSFVAVNCRLLYIIRLKKRLINCSQVRILHPESLHQVKLWQHD